ncbi:MAG: PAS domain S-box protein [Flavobacteriales bacterium]|nr:PAS domain S-box protein [Flavobacteriales bacterium]
MTVKKKKQTLPIDVESEKNFQRFLDNLPYPSVIHTDGKYVYANKAAAKLFKVKSPKTLIGKDALAVIHKDFKKVSRERIKEIYANGFSPERENLVVDSNGKAIIVKIAGTLIIYKGQSSILSTLQNINDQRNFEDQLKASEQQYRQLVENVNEGIVKFNNKEIITYVNKRFCEIVGYSAKELLGIVGHHLLITTNEAKETVRQAISARLKGESSKYEIQMLTKSKKLIWVSINGNPIFDEDGNYDGSMGIMRDISYSKKGQLALEQSERRFRSLFENARDLIQSVSPEGKFLFVNEAWLRCLGYNRADLENLTIMEVIHPDSMEHWKIKFEQVLQGRSVDNVQATFIKKNGERVEVQGSATLHRTEDGQIMTQGIFTDVTRDRIAELNLKKSEERFRTLVEKMNEGIIMVDNNEVIEYVNRRFCEIVGFKSSELVGQLGPEILVHDIVSKDRIKNIVEFRKDGFSSKYEVRYKRKSGEWIDVSVNGTPLYNEAGKVRGSMGIVTDITEARAAEEALLESEEKYRMLVEKMNEGVLQFNGDGIIEYVNVRFCEILGYPKWELLGQNRIDVLSVDPDSMKEIKKTIRSRKNGESFKYELRHQRKNGDWIWISINETPLRNDNGKTIGSMGIVTDITESKLNAEALFSSEERYRTLNNAAFDAIVISDHSGKIISWNRGAENIFGYAQNDILGRDLTTIMPKHYKKKHEEGFYRFVKTKDPVYLGKVLELEGVRKNGEIFPIEINLTSWETSSGLFFSGIIRDITERKRIEQDRVQINERLEERVKKRTQELQKANTEIRSLLREMHHRVKNNLQIVSSLLNMQAASVTDEYVINAFRESQDRIQTMAFIHESLYLNESMSEISVKKYLVPLVKDRIKANSDLVSRIQLTTNFLDINFKIDTMLPIGLLLNELVTNSLKHAFPKKREGKITVSIEKNAKNSLCLKYSDDGVGYPMDTTADSGGSLGLILIESFAMQLDGELKRKAKKGTHYEIVFEPT